MENNTPGTPPKSYGKTILLLLGVVLIIVIATSITISIIAQREDNNQDFGQNNYEKLMGHIDFVSGNISKIISLEKVFPSSHLGKDDPLPLVVGLQLQAEIATGENPSTIKRYYFNIDDPQRKLEVKFTPINIPYIYFSIPRIPGEYRFAAEIYNNNGSFSSSGLIVTTEEPTKIGPTIFFSPSSENLDIPMVTLKVLNQSGHTVTFETVSKTISQKKDFDENKQIVYDFDGDGNRDLTTGNNIVQHTYMGEKEYITAHVKVIYNGYKGIATSEKIYIGNSDMKNPRTPKPNILTNKTVGGL